MNGHFLIYRNLFSISSMRMTTGQIIDAGQNESICAVFQNNVKNHDGQYIVNLSLSCDLIGALYKKNRQNCVSLDGFRFEVWWRQGDSNP